MTALRLLGCLVLLVSAGAAGVVPADPAAADETTAVDGFAAQTSAPTLVTMGTTVNETQPEAGANFTLTTHIENIEDGNGDILVENVEIRRADGEILTEETPNERLWSGNRLENGQSLSLDDAGEYNLSVRVELRHADGDDYVVRHPVAVTVYDPHPAMTVETESTLPGSRTTLNLSLTNGDDDLIRNVQLRLRGENVSVKDNRRSVARLSATSAETFEYEVTGKTSGTANLTADLEYTTANGTHRRTTRTLTPTFTRLSNPGTVELTGVSVSRRGQTLQVSGSASNVGTTDVLGVTVGVESNQKVSAGQSSGEYFVGEVASSDFNSFKVRATLDANASTVTIPLRVSYIVDDVRRNRTVPVTYDVPQRPAESSVSESDSSLPLSVIGGGSLLGLVALAGGWRWFRGD
ncbi:COG1361 family protein [Halorussus pelagicus]|uniref:hypothetical protein n=1 Tax=Halorussus pelagicus TaxID=2505977 RepID=UPI000FFC6AB4|nr:hypothetical protein [Halorussus pelagicus]